MPTVKVLLVSFLLAALVACDAAEFPEDTPDAGTEVFPAAPAGCTTSSCYGGLVQCCPGHGSCYNVARGSVTNYQCCISANRYRVRGACMIICQRAGQPDPGLTYPRC